MASTLPSTPIFNAISKHDPKSLAIVHSASDRSFCYGSLLYDIAAAKDNLTDIANGKSLHGERIAFLAENGYDYVVTFLSILAHDAVALPLAFTHPSSELRYILENSEAALFLSTEKFQHKAHGVLSEGLVNKPKLEILTKIETGAITAENVKFEEKALNRAGFMLYTSGTTSRPKGVVLSMSTITAQALSLMEAWRYTSRDLLLHVLPLHHIHGTINALFTPLMAGSTIEFAYPFNADVVWKRLAAPFLPDVRSPKEPITFLTVVPTIYNRLLATFPQLDDSMKFATKKAISPLHMRLNISGSAALPTPTKAAWTELSGGNVLLERYGMTEVGMALSCGLAYADRVDGSVGWPLPSVEVRLVDTDTSEVIPPGQEIDAQGRLREGEIQLRGPTVFSEYFRNRQATEAEFVDASDGKGKWFKTGDIATRRYVDGAGQSGQAWAKGPMYFIRGRKSVDIIKTGGEKVSALEVERELLSLPEIAEAAVVGIASEQWGQKVAAVVTLTPEGQLAGRGGKQWSSMDMRRALKEKLANYKIPQELKVVENIPRNAMGKSCPLALSLLAAPSIAECIPRAAGRGRPQRAQQGNDHPRHSYRFITILASCATAAVQAAGSTTPGSKLNHAHDPPQDIEVSVYELIRLLGRSYPMAAATPSNVFEEAAGALNAAANRTLAEKIFQDALKDAQAEAASKNEKELLEYLSSISDAASLKKSLEQELQGKTGHVAYNWPSRRLARVFRTLEKPMELARRISDCNQMIAKPVVGVLCYIMMIVQEISDIDDLIVDFEEQTKRNLEAFKTYFLRGHELSDPLIQSLRLFYRAIMDFGLFATHLLNGFGGMYVKMLSGDPKGKLRELVQRLEKRADWVYQTANGETYVRVIAVENAVAEPPAAASLDPMSSTASRSVSVPMVLSPYFSGREAQLDEMAQILGDIATDRPTELALWGLPGVGKSQLSLRYVQWTIDGRTSPEYGQVIFLRANDQATLGTEFRRVAKGLGLVKDALLEQRDEDLIVEAVKAWFRQTERWLLVFDNVVKSNDLLKFRPTEGKGHIIYTTRSKATAELLCRVSNALELRPMGSAEGAILVKTLMGTSQPQTVETNAAIDQVSAFARGLPLAIEQISLYAKFEQITLQGALEIVKRKETFLAQKGIDSFHQENLSTGAILVTAFESIAKKYSMAGVLFQVLAYLEPSSIAISVLIDGASEMDSYLTRSETYTRGAIRTREGEEGYLQMTSAKKFDLLDYDGPLDPELWRRLFRRGKHDKKNRPPSLPRVDSPNDIEMQRFWQSNTNLRGVFNDKDQMEKALNQLEGSGLVKRIGINTVWIHDLFAELMTAYTTAMESKKQSEAKVHMTATLVWLAMPIPQTQRFGLRELCFEYLPHAQSCLRHLREHGTLLTDATIGAELSHVVASAFALRRGLDETGKAYKGDPQQEILDLRTSLGYYKDAYRGYMSAQNRLMAQLKERGEEDVMYRIAMRTRFEIEAEAECQLMGKPWTYYSPKRWIRQFERFGGNAVWRSLQTCSKVGQILWQLQELKEAEPWVRTVKFGVEAIWGPGLEVEEVNHASSDLINLLVDGKDWSGALIVARERRGRFEDIVRRGLPGLDQMGLPSTIGTCLFELGKWNEGMHWLRIALIEARWNEGRYGKGVWGVTVQLAKRYGEMEDWRHCLNLWVDAVWWCSINVQDMLREENLDAAEQGVRTAWGKCEERGLDCLDDAVQEGEREAQWEDLKAKVQKALEVLATVRENARVNTLCAKLKDSVWDDESDVDARELQQECLRMAEEDGVTREWLMDNGRSE